MCQPQNGEKTIVVCEDCGTEFEVEFPNEPLPKHEDPGNPFGGNCNGTTGCPKDEYDLLK